MLKPKSDFPTVILHWAIVIALTVSLFTGLRIAADSPESTLARTLASILPQGNVIYWHLLSALALLGLFVAYIVFIWRAGMASRIALNASLWEDIKHPHDRRARWRAINILVYWLAFLALLIAVTTGLVMDILPGLMPYALAGTIHQYAAWALPIYMLAHIVALCVMGGIAYLLKIFRPRPAYGIAAGLSLIAGVAAAAALFTLEQNATQTLTVAQADSLPVLDGSPDDEIWRKAKPVTVSTNRGINAIEGGTDVTIRAAYRGEHFYGLIQWIDTSRSQKHLPLIRTENGWRVQQTEYGIQDEDLYYEDKFGIMLARGGGLAGDHTIHLGGKPLANRPGPSGGRGLHYTTDGSIVDVWHWKSVRTGNAVMNQIDDNYFGPPMEPKEGKRYTGGYTKDPKDGGGYYMNWETFSDDLVTPRRLPADPSTLAKFNGVDLTPDVGDNVALYLLEADTVEYDPALDTLENFPVDTILPAVIVKSPMTGDRGDVTAVSRWKEGVWTMEIKRKLDTGSEFDIAFTKDLPTYLWVAAFDHAQTRHSRHLYPIVVELK